MNKTTTLIISAIVAIFLLTSSSAATHNHRDFLECLSEESGTSISNVTYTPTNSSYASIFRHYIINLRLVSPSTLKPQFIITPEHESQIPPIVLCARKNDLQIRTRSGGHDYEGLSYLAQLPFVVIDLVNLSGLSVDLKEKTAWVGAGATVGSLYYRLAEQSSVLGFAGTVWPTVGVGGSFSGGGYGAMVRKHGMAADNVIDARIVDVNGRILDRSSMGEDLFWAIRGGGGASFGVILAWKLKLVDVPEQVAFCVVQRTIEQNMTQLVQRGQSIAHSIDPRLYIHMLVQRANSTAEAQRNFTLRATFTLDFLGGSDGLLPIVQEKFPELGLTREDCNEMSWIDSVVSFAGFPTGPREILLNRTLRPVRYSKAKSDTVQRAIPQDGLEGLWRFLYEPEGEDAQVIFIPFGGIMDNISESAIPFPNRAESLYEIQYLTYWDDARDSDRFMSWIRRLYSYMAPYVSSSPRRAYYNYRDFDLGVNNIEGKVSYARASVWGKRYFANNFDRLVRVKTAVDPQNYFRNEQSIPSLVEGKDDS